MRTVVSRIAYAVLIVWCAVTGLAYIPPLGRLPDQLDVVNRMLSEWGFGGAWLLAAGLLIAGQWCYRPRQIGLALAMGLTLMLAGGYAVAWIGEDQARAWVSLKNYVMLATLILVLAVHAERVMPGAPTHQ
ncbi:hypothetical protein [Corynebacterium aquilae]|uniref:hypothetical protein n=1 Tax=Corynebacterium aquilae TaxID=203263 RepID=UPI0012ED5FEA|nr:hypothetical protein [Corynebacterium aquilae]